MVGLLGCFRRPDTAELSDMRIRLIEGLRKSREDKMLIKDKTKVACRLSG